MTPLGANALAWRPADRRPIYEWASENVNLPSAYAIQGPFHVEKSRYLIEPFHAIADDSVRVVTVRKGIQTGGSMLADITSCHVICNRPMHVFWNFPTDDAALDYGNRRAMPLFEACPPIAQKFSSIHRHKKRKNEILFGPMFIALQGANKRNLQSHSVPFIINDELWEWDVGMYQQALGRVAYYSWRSKVLNISQAGELGDDLDQEYEAGTQEVWHFSCPECRVYQPFEWTIRLRERGPDGQPKFAGMTWDTNGHTRPGGKWHFERLKPTIRYRCAYCGHDIHDTPPERRALNDTGRFEVKNPHASHERRSFHWNSIACDEVRWEVLVEEYLRAKDQEKLGNRIPLREFWKKRMAEPFDVERHSSVDLLPTIDIVTQSDKGAEIQGVLFQHRLAAVDVQHTSFWMLVQMWSAAGDILTCWGGQCYSWEEVAQRQQEFGVQSKNLLVDVQHRRQEVIRECVRRGQKEALPDKRLAWFSWKAMEGTDLRGFTHKVKVPGKPDKSVLLPYSEEQKADPCLGLRDGDPLLKELAGRRCPLYRWSNPWIKDIVIDRRDGKTGLKFLTASGEWNAEFSRQMHSQRKRLIQDKLGQGKWKWEKFRDDHLLDCACMIMVRAFQLRILGDNPQAIAA